MAMPHVNTQKGTALRGRVWKFGHQVSGDDGIIDFSAVRDGFGKPFDEPLLKSMCFRRLNPRFPLEVKPGDIVVAGENFAHHNHIEVSASIKLSGIAVVVVDSCESGFIRRALSQGLPILTLPGISSAVEDGDVITVDPATGRVELPGGRVLQARPFSDRMLAVWQAGGLVESLRREFAAR
jgi:3-isopropylmalate/(R)-2-methylmalate dehydratase small subunit